MVSGETVVAAGAIGLLGAEAAGVTNIGGGGGEDSGGGPPGFGLGGLNLTLPSPAAPDLDLDLGGAATGGATGEQFAALADAMATAVEAGAQAGTEQAGDTTETVTETVTGVTGGGLDGLAAGAFDTTIPTTEDVTGTSPADVSQLLRADPSQLGERAGAATASAGTGFVGGFVSRLDAGMEEAARKVVVEGVYMGDEGQSAESRAEELKNRYGGGDRIGLGDIARAAGASDPTDPATIRESAEWWANLGPDVPAASGTPTAGGGSMAPSNLNILGQSAGVDAAGSVASAETPDVASLSAGARQAFAGGGSTGGDATAAGSDGRGTGSRTTSEPSTSQATVTREEDVKKRLSVPTASATAVGVK